MQPRSSASTGSPSARQPPVPRSPRVRCCRCSRPAALRSTTRRSRGRTRRESWPRRLLRASGRSSSSPPRASRTRRSPCPTCGGVAGPTCSAVGLPSAAAAGGRTRRPSSWPTGSRRSKAGPSTSRWPPRTRSWTSPSSGVPCPRPHPDVSDPRAGTARRRCRTGPGAGSACRRVLPRCRCGTWRRRRGAGRLRRRCRRR